MRPDVLLVEDDPNDQFLFSLAFSDAGFPYELIVLGNGAEAVAYLSSARCKEPAGPLPGIMFVDLKMPVVSGFDVLAWLRQQDFHIPVVVLTSSFITRDIKRAHELGAVDYQVKPTTPWALKCVITHCISQFFRPVEYSPSMVN